MKYYKTLLVSIDEEMSDSRICAQDVIQNARGHEYCCDNTVKINEVIPKSILEKYFEYLNEENATNIRVEIKEDEEYGYAIVELKEGTPHEIYYQKYQKTWF